MPELGVVGAGISTTACRWLVAFAHFAVIVRLRFPFERRDFRPDRTALLGLLRLGVPAGLQLALEIGIFALSSFFIARFEPSVLAAHHLLLQVATFTFMVPVGIAGAGAVRVGQAIGAGLVPLELGELNKHEIWLTYRADAKQSARIRKTIDWIVKCFDPGRYPWFREDFIHPARFAETYKGKRLTGLLTDARAHA